MATDNLNAALSWVYRGWHVFPLAPGTKKPLHPGGRGYLDATRDVVTIHRWWRECPDANIGGAMEASGLYAIDIDVADGKPGNESLQALIDKHGPLPATYTSRTRSGGTHLVFAMPDPPLANFAGTRLGKGIDGRGNGYIVLPPSEVDGGVYEIVDDSEPAQMPAWMVEAIRMTGRRRDGGGGEGRARPKDLLSYLEHKAKELEALKPGDPAETPCNDVAYELSHYIASGQLGLDEVRSRLRAAVDTWTDGHSKGYEGIEHGLRDHKTGWANTEPRYWKGRQGGALLLPAPDRPMPVARAMLSGWRPDGGGTSPTLRHWRGEWMLYDGTRYREISEQAVRNELYTRTEHASYEKVNSKGEVVETDWNPNHRKISELLGAMKAVHALPDETRPGTWLDGRKDASGSLIALQNTLLDPATRGTLPHTSDYFDTRSLPFSYDPQAACPRWLRFLDTCFPGDREAIDLLQEWFGYVLSGRTGMQKMMFLKGATRSGKGVTARVLRKLLGEENTAAPTFSSFGTNFGLSSLIGAPLAVIGDARSSSKVDMQLVIERILSITGEDQIDIDRKNRSIWTGTLPTRLMMLSNERPWFRDASGAITGRIMMLVYSRSFLGREDPFLDRDLEAELPGILNWSLDGLDRLDKNGRFTVPASSEQEMRDLADEISPIKAFVRERCELGPSHKVSGSDLLRAWQDFNGEYPHEGQRERMLLKAQITSAFPEVKPAKVRVGGPPVQGYRGIRLV